MDNWVNRVLELTQQFARRFSTIYNSTERELYAAFEIGCFLALVRHYEVHGWRVIPQQLVDNEYRYLTSPNGNPDNFSYILLQKGRKFAQLRQQVRIKSHIDQDISFTPDIVVLKNDAIIAGRRYSDYASGKRDFFSIDADQVIAAHECKSLQPFPELLVSFLGMLVAGHSWLNGINDRSMVDDNGEHLAPTLFIGGAPRGFQLRMITSMKNVFPINIILGMHSGTWDLRGNKIAMIRHLSAVP